MRSQRMEMCDGAIFGVAFCPGAVIIRITELPRLSSSDSYWPDKKPADFSAETKCGGPGGCYATPVGQSMDPRRFRTIGIKVNVGDA
jgi:hypothetical protein